MEICDKDIICWVKCYFEKVGKIIVIENSRGCVDGVVYRERHSDGNAKINQQIRLDNQQVQNLRTKY